MAAYNKDILVGSRLSVFACAELLLFVFVEFYLAMCESESVPVRACLLREDNAAVLGRMRVNGIP